MNIVESSYKVGLVLKKVKQGKDLLQLYREAQESVPVSVWKNYEKIGRKKWGKHYFIYPYALSVYKENRDKENLPLSLKEEIEMVLNSEKINKFSNACKEFGMVLEEMAEVIFQPTLYKKFLSIDTPPKLVRSIQDLSISCHRTGLLKQIMKIYKLNGFEEKIDKYEEKKKDLDLIPFNHDVRMLIRTVADEKISKESLYIMETFSVMLNVIKQVIFESHFDLILNLSNEDISIIKKYERNKLILIAIRLNEHMINIMNWNGSIISFSEGNKIQYALVSKRKLSWKDSSIKIEVWGMMYPYNDTIS